MSVIKSFSHNEYGCTIVFEADYDQTSYYVGYNVRILTPRDVMNHLLLQISQRGREFTIADHDAFLSELTAKLDEPHTPSEDPKMLELADGDAVITIDGLSEKELLTLALLAHERDITLNQLFVEIIKAYIAEKDPS